MSHTLDPYLYVEEAFIQVMLAHPTIEIPKEYEESLAYNIPWCLCNEASVCRCAENMHKRIYGQFDCDADDLRKCKRYYTRMLFENKGT